MTCFGRMSQYTFSPHCHIVTLISYDLPICFSPNCFQVVNMVHIYLFTEPIELSLPVSIEQANLLLDPIATLSL